MLPNKRKDALQQGYTHYYTGKTCRNGHVDVRFAKDGACKTCTKEKRVRLYRANPDTSKKISREWKARNKLHTSRYIKQWRADNKDHVQSYGKEYRNKNRDRRNSQKEQWRKKNLCRVREYNRKRYRENMNHRVAHKMRSMVYRVSGKMSCSCLPYTPLDLRGRLEVQFKPGMGWHNYGEWEIDHKIPVSVMLKRGVKDPCVINALSNLQPLWKSDNRRKNNRYSG